MKISTRCENSYGLHVYTTYKWTEDRDSVAWASSPCGVVSACGEFKLFSMEPGQQKNEFADDMRGWAANQKISGKTVDLLKKEDFDSMEALILIDSDDLSQTKIQRGQQKLLLKALLSLQSTVCGEDTGSAAATDGDNTPATGTRDPADVTIAWNETHADGTQGTQTDGIQRDDVYTSLMADRVRSMDFIPFGRIPISRVPLNRVL